MSVFRRPMERYRGKQAFTGAASPKRETIVTPKAPWFLSLAVVVATAATPTPARADFFDDLRRTFTTDIPHFFQDDIPCAFGGEPTSGAKKACKSSPPQQAKPVTRETAPPDTNAPRDTTIEQKGLAPPRAAPGTD